MCCVGYWSDVDTLPVGNPDWTDGIPLCEGYWATEPVCAGYWEEWLGYCPGANEDVVWLGYCPAPVNGLWPTCWVVWLGYCPTEVVDGKAPDWDGYCTVGYRPVGPYIITKNIKWFYVIHFYLFSINVIMSNAKLIFAYKNIENKNKFKLFSVYTKSNRSRKLIECPQ